jgi:hypothetical protein
VEEGSWEGRVGVEGEGLEEAGSLGFGFGEFGVRDGIGDDAGAGMEPGVKIADDGGADGDAELAFAVESEVAMASAVGAAGDGFEGVDDFHGAELGGTGDGTAWETGGEGIEMGQVRAELGLDGGDEVLDLGEGFETEEVGDLDGAEFGDATEVIAEEVGDHDEFGAFLFAGGEFEGEGEV